MGMVKIIDPTGWDLGGPTVTQVKVARTGLRGDDLKEFIKHAGHWLADEVRRLDLSPGEVPIHLIAMGSTEAYGINRNGDGWRNRYLDKYHPTFVKHARFYREHANKNPEKSYGVVKHSYFNPTMQRVELIVALNGTREAASRNKGLLADKELEKLASEQPFGVSMSCRVPFDFCSSCSNRARTRAEYCKGTHEGGTCKAGGLTNNIGAVLEDGHQLHADNRESLFSDISHVGRPADPTAWVTGQLEKSAAALVEMPTQEPTSRDEPLFLHPLEERQLQRLAKLAADLSAYEGMVDRLLAHTITTQADSRWDLPSSVKVSHALAAMGELGVLPTPEGFLRLVGGPRGSRAAAALYSALPGSFNGLTKTATLERVVGPWLDVLDTKPSIKALSWARALVSTNTLDPVQLATRLKLASLEPRVSPPMVKQASTAARSLSESYAGLRLALLDKWRLFTPDFDLTCRVLAAQNLV